MLQTLDDLIQSHGDRTQDQDRRDQHIELEELMDKNERNADPNSDPWFLKKFFRHAIKSALPALYK